MAGARLEVLVEPFRENDPGAHVTAAIDALDRAGLGPDMGPFATVAGGDVDAIAGALAPMVLAAFANGAASVQIRIDRDEE